MSGQSFTFADPAVQRCPFEHYQKLRAEAPVYLDPGTRLYVLTRYEDVRAALMDHGSFSNITGLVQTRTSKEATELFEKKGWLPVPTLLNNDPPGHKFFRSFVDKAFTAKRTAELQVYIERSVSERTPTIGE